MKTPIEGECPAEALAKADPPMNYVYILQSEPDPERFYIGLTSNPERRLREHNAGKSIHTNKHKPWILAVCIGFADHTKAVRFERYLKSGSGRAFAKRHF